MMPAPLAFEEMSAKSTSVLQGKLIEDTQESAKSSSVGLLDLAGKGLTFAGDAALNLVTIDNTIMAAGIVGSALFGPEVLVATEALQQFNKSLDNIEFVKKAKVKIEEFVRTSIKKAVKQVLKTVWGWFSKKK